MEPDPMAADRRQFLRGLGACSVAAGGAILGVAPTWSEEQDRQSSAGTARKTETNLGEFMKVPRTRWSIPGPFPGRVVQVTDPRSVVERVTDAAVIREMVADGVSRLTGKGAKESFGLFFTPDDVVGLKVNPA